MNDAAPTITTRAPTLAVIIPVGPGDSAWRGLLGQLHWLPGATQLRLVGCRPEDVDAAALAAHPALPADRGWLLAERGRARQLNAGAAATHSDFLWFLHADTRITVDPVRIVAALDAAMAVRTATLWYFDLQFLSDGPAATWLNGCGAWLRSHLLRLPFGDQGFLLSRDTFERLGQFDETLASAEDHALVWTARHQGVALRGTDVRLGTSARRYADHGWLATTWRHLSLTWQQARQFSRRKPGAPP